MSTRLSRLGRIAVVLVATFLGILGGAYYWLFFDNRMPTSGSYALDIKAIRAEAARIPGDKANVIEVETLSHTRQPKIAIVAGTSWERIDLVRESYDLVFPEQPIIIDTGYDAAVAKAAEVDSFDTAAWQRMLAAMRRASCLLGTGSAVRSRCAVTTLPSGYRAVGSAPNPIRRTRGWNSLKGVADLKAASSRLAGRAWSRLSRMLWRRPSRRSGRGAFRIQGREVLLVAADHRVGNCQSSAG